MLYICSSNQHRRITMFNNTQKRSPATVIIMNVTNTWKVNQQTKIISQVSFTMHMLLRWTDSRGGEFPPNQPKELKSVKIDSYWPLFHYHNDLIYFTLICNVFLKHFGACQRWIRAPSEDCQLRNSLSLEGLSKNHK